VVTRLSKGKTESNNGKKSQGETDLDTPWNETRATTKTYGIEKKNNNAEELSSRSKLKTGTETGTNRDPRNGGMAESGNGTCDTAGKRSWCREQKEREKGQKVKQ